MRFTILSLTVSTLLFTASTFAAETIGTVTASGAFQLREADIPASAARSLPLLDGDEVETKKSTAVIVLNDSSRVAVRKNSRVKVERQGKETKLHLLKGGLGYSLGAGSLLTILVMGREVSTQSGSVGSVAIDKGEVIATRGQRTVSGNTGPGRYVNGPPTPPNLTPRSPSDCRNPDPGNDNSPCSSRDPDDVGPGQGQGPFDTP